MSAQPGIASDATNREIAATFARFHLLQREYLEAEAALMDHLAGDQGDAVGWNLLGVARLERGKPGEAELAFSQAVATADSDDPYLGVYLYNRADALSRAGEADKARDLLLQASSLDTVSVSARSALGRLKAGAPLPRLRYAAKPSTSRSSSAGEWGASLIVASGYDNNVLLASDTNLATASRTDTASPFVATYFQGQYARDLGAGELGARGLVSYAYQTNSVVRQYNGMSSSFGANYATERWGLDNQFDLSYLNTNGLRFYNWTDSLGLMRKFHLNDAIEARFTLPAYYKRFAFEEGDDPADDRTGFGARPEAAMRIALGGGLVSVGVYYEHHLAKGANFRARSLGVPVFWSAPLGWKFVGTVSAEPALVRYFEADTGRADRILKTGISVSRPILAKTFGSMEYGFQRSESNLESATYSRHSFSFLMAYELF